MTQLTFLEISELCDTCLEKERNCLDAGDLSGAEFYSKVWGILIEQMKNR